jgi:mannose-1-phosphate guanylyltransferase|nr:sugar phosphate nucleotidyltransferase [Kofleriaceae bacterium]
MPAPRRYRTSASPLGRTDAAAPWTLVLAGGEGVRLADYVERRFGHRTPKQYCNLLGDRSMLEHTLDRLATLVPASRTLAVIGTHHAAVAAPQLAGRAHHVFRQPGSRDTGVALYVALAMIRRASPHAIVTVTPADHFVRPAAAYVAQVSRVQALAARDRERVFVVGVRPTEPDPDLGYLALGAMRRDGTRAVDGFVEKPARGVATQLVRNGALWNTMVTCASATALWELAREANPAFAGLLDALLPLVNTPDEDDAIESLYRAVPGISFSKDLLERAPGRLAAFPLAGVDWSDWGKAERVETGIARERRRAAIAAAASPSPRASAVAS